VTTRASDLLSRAEIRELTRASDLRGALSLLTDWVLVAAGMALVAWRPHVLTVLAALVLIGARQLGLAVLMHECAHRSLFRTRWLNDLLGKWLCAAPIWTDVVRYREHHLRHHAHTGTERDPDLGLVKPFPTTRASLLRKITRDLLGLTALKRIVAQLAMELGFLAYTASTETRRLPPIPWSARLKKAARHLTPVVLANAALFGVLFAFGHPALYLLWVGAWMTTYNVVLRIRSIAEHACTEESDDVVRNTRTTRVALPMRLVAPHDVAYHLEHHLLMTVPHYRLPQMHALLAERDVFDETNHAPGYASVLTRVTRA